VDSCSPFQKHQVISLQDRLDFYSLGLEARQDLRKEIKKICKSINKAETEEAFDRFAELEDIPTSGSEEVMLYISYSYLKYYLESSERLTIPTGSDNKLKTKRAVKGKIKTIKNSLNTIKEIATMFEALPKGGLFSGFFRQNSKRKLSRRCRCIDRKGECFTELFEQYNDTLQRLRQLSDALAFQPKKEVSTTSIIEIKDDSIRDIFSQYEDELRDRDEKVEKFKIMMGEELEQLAQESAAEIREASGEEESQDSVSLDVTVHDVDSIEVEVYVVPGSEETLVQEDISESEIVSEEEVSDEVEPVSESIEAEIEEIQESNLDSTEVSIDEDIAEFEDVVAEEVISEVTDTITVLEPETTSDIQVIPADEEVSGSEDVVAEEVISETTAMISEHAMDLKVEETSRPTEVVGQKDTSSVMLFSEGHGVAEYCNSKVNSIIESSTFVILKKWLDVVEFMDGDTLEISLIIIGEADDTWRNKGVKHTFIETKGCRGIGKELDLKEGDKISNETIALLRMLSAEMYVNKGIESTLSMLEQNGEERPYVKVRPTKVSHKDYMKKPGKQSGPKYRKKLVILKCHTCG